MPFLIPLAPVIAAIAGAGGAATSIYEAVNQPGAPKISSTPNPLTAQQQGDVKGAVANQLPDLQAQLGGSVSPDYLLQLSQTLAGTNSTPGTSGIAQSAVNSFLGNNSSGNFTPAGVNPNQNLVGDQLQTLTNNSFLG